MAQTDNRLSASTVRALASQYSDWDPESVVRIAWRESNFVPTAFADDSDDLSYGLMQLNMKEGTADIQRLRQMFGITRNEELFNPVVNMRAAHILYQAAGNSFSPWNVVPPFKNYPSEGGSTTIPSTDDQGNPAGLTDEEIQKVYSILGIKRLSNQMKTEVVKAYLLAVDGRVAGTTLTGTPTWPPTLTGVASLTSFNWPATQPSEADTALIRRYWNEMQGIEDMGDSGLGVNLPGFAGIGDWMAGLGRLLSNLTSLAFWKKVGVGFIAFILIVGALVIYNKDKAVPIITKGAVKDV